MSSSRPKDSRSTGDPSALDSICFHFERLCADGKRPRVEDFLAGLPKGIDRSTVLTELLILEVEYRRKEGEEIQRSTLVDRFPNDASVIDLALDYLGKREFRTVSAVFTGGVSQLPQRIGRYIPRKFLGEGGMGAVVLADDPDLGRSVAIKMPKLTDGRAVAWRRRFIREARAAAALRHPNICTVHEVGEQDGQPYLVMSWIEGLNLSALLKTKGVLDPEYAAALVRKMALALEVAHSHGIVHRDIKPSNIMVDTGGEPVLMDFGLASLASDNTQITGEGEFLGTPAYMSPEQVKGRHDIVGPASDVYSLGVVLYELVTGTKPFEGSAFEVSHAAVYEEAEPPSKRRKGLDPRIDAVCDRSMQKRPEDRFESMVEFAESLDRFLREPKPTPPKPTPQIRVQCPKCRHQLELKSLPGPDTKLTCSKCANQFAFKLTRGIIKAGPAGTEMTTSNRPATPRTPSLNKSRSPFVGESETESPRSDIPMPAQKSGAQPTASQPSANSPPTATSSAPADRLQPPSPTTWAPSHGTAFKSVETPMSGETSSAETPAAFPIIDSAPVVSLSSPNVVIDGKTLFLGGLGLVLATVVLILVIFGCVLFFVKHLNHLQPAISPANQHAAELRPPSKLDVSSQVL